MQFYLLCTFYAQKNWSEDENTDGENWVQRNYEHWKLDVIDPRFDEPGRFYFLQILFCCIVEVVFWTGKKLKRNERNMCVQLTTTSLINKKISSSFLEEAKHSFVNRKTPNKTF